MSPDGSRRRFLRTCSLPLAAGLAGCGFIGGGDDPTATASSTPTDASTDAPVETPTEDPTETTTTIRRECDPGWDPERRWQRPIETPEGPTEWATRWDGDDDRLLVWADGHVAAVTQAGDLAWERELTADDVVSLRNDRVVLANAGAVRAVTLPAVETLWRFVADEHATHRAVTLGDRVFVYASKFPNTSQNFEETFARLYALDAETGDVKWRIDDVALGRISTMYAVGVHVFLYDSTEGLHVVSPDRTVVTVDGPLLGDRDVNQWGPVRDGTLFVTDIINGVYAVSTNSGEIQWRRYVGTAIAGLVGDVLVVVDHADDVSLTAIDVRSGRTVSEATLGTREYVTGVTNDECAFLATRVGDGENERSRVVAFDLESGCREGSFELAGTPTPALTPTSSTVYWPISTGDGAVLHAISAP